MPQQQLASWLALYHMPGLSTLQLCKLCEHFGSPAGVLKADPAQLAALSIDRKSLAAIRYQQTKGCLPESVRVQVDYDLAWLAAAPARFILSPDSEHYPPLLNQIADAPPVLYGEGSLSVLSSPMLAMVGTRKPSSAGRRLARRFSRALGEAGMTICSGLALGIDGESHQGAMDGGGRTVAVLGSGLERLYPARNKNLLGAMLAGGGAVVSEFPLRAEPLPWRFPQRNRIVTGLSLGVLVVEAAKRSGSLISARCAIEQGREVFTLPGSPDNPQARGCHALIREGALLVERPEDIIAELGHFSDRYHPEKQEDATPAQRLSALEQRIMAAVGYDQSSITCLQSETGLDVGTLTSSLSALELKGCLVRDGAAFVRTVSSDDA